MKNSLATVNQIISVGSVDGVCTSAALLRLIGAEGGEVGLQFTQAFTVDKIDPEAWLPGRRVAFVDLAVNNHDPEMTRGFIARLREAGHTLVAVIDEHSREDWIGVLGTFEGLIVEPRSQNAGDGPKSSGAVVLRWMGDASIPIYGEVQDLLFAADAGDRMDFTTHFGGLVNQAVKSAIADDTRRVYLARHFAEHREPDDKIRGWIGEYEVILQNHDTIVAGQIDLGDGIVRVTATGLSVDMTTLMGRLYKEGARVVVLEGEAFNKKPWAQDLAGLVRGGGSKVRSAHADQGRRAHGVGVRLQGEHRPGARAGGARRRPCGSHQVTLARVTARRRRGYGGHGKGTPLSPHAPHYALHELRGVNIPGRTGLHNLASWIHSRT